VTSGDVPDHGALGQLRLPLSLRFTASGLQIRLQIGVRTWGFLAFLCSLGSRAVFN
jgi:hypothetical protein